MNRRILFQGLLLFVFIKSLVCFIVIYEACCTGMIWLIKVHFSQCYMLVISFLNSKLIFSSINSKCKKKNKKINRHSATQITTLHSIRTNIVLQIWMYIYSLKKFVIKEFFLEISMLYKVKTKKTPQVTCIAGQVRKRNIHQCIP